MGASKLVLELVRMKKEKKGGRYRREDWQPTTAVSYYGICLI